MSWRNVILNDKQYNYEYFSKSHNVCRICWCQNASIEISNIGENIKILFDKINYCLEMTLTQFDHINKICEGCIGEIKNFYEFITFCRESDIKIRRILETGCVTEEPDVKCESPCSEATIEPFEDLHEDKVCCFELETIENKVKTKVKYVKSSTSCNFCYLNFKTKHKLASHNSEIHGIEENGTLFKCFGCEKRFKSRKTRLGHEINHCSSLKDGYQCSVCERCLPKRRMYEIHIRDHLHNLNTDLPDKVFDCNKCIKVFQTKQSLNKHNLSEHEDYIKKFICDTCGRVFSRQDYLYKHKLTHTGVKRYSCPHCEFRATQRSSLTVHIRKHTGERPFSCDLCPQRCISSSNLRAHRRRHLGSKNYECTICNKKFGYKVSLDEHISSNHERAEIHSCEHCGATYSRLRGLKRHLAAKHRNKDDLPQPAQVTGGGEDGRKAVQYELREGDLLEIKGADCEVLMV